MAAEIVPFIVGVDGLIGDACWSFFRKQHPLTSGTSLRGTDGLPRLDIRNPDLGRLDVNFALFTHAIIAAASSNARQCELDPAASHACNVLGTLELSKQFMERGIQPVLFSTDYVFDGIQGGYRESDLVSPLNEYGRQKAELEKRVQEEGSDLCLIVRLAKVFPYKARGVRFLAEISDKLARRERVRATTDQVFSPIILEDAIQGLAALMQKQAKGIYHLGGPENWTRYDLAKEIARKMGIEEDLIDPISLDDLKEPFRRPVKIDIISEKFKLLTGIETQSFATLISQNFTSRDLYCV